MEQPKPSPPASLDAELTRLKSEIADLQARVSALEGGVPPIPLPHREPTESRFGLTIINRIGAATLAIGIIFFFKYAVDNQWIGAAGRVLLGVVAGTLLIGAAEWLRRRNQQAFAVGLGGCGLATLYISAYAASAYYNLLPRPVSFLALIAVCACAILLSIAYANLAIAVLGFLGALLTPLLLELAALSEWIAFDFVYFGVLEITAIAIAMTQGWRVLLPIVAALTTLAAARLIDPHHPEAFIAFMLCLAALHVRREVYSRVVAHAALLIAALRYLALWAKQHITMDDRLSFISESGSVLLGVYGIVVLAYGIARQSPENRALGLVLLGVVVGKLYLYDVWLLTRFYRITAFVALGALLLAASYLYSRFKQRA